MEEVIDFFQKDEIVNCLRKLNDIRWRFFFKFIKPQKVTFKNFMNSFFSIIKSLPDNLKQIKTLKFELDEK